MIRRRVSYLGFWVIGADCSRARSNYYVCQSHNASSALAQLGRCCRFLCLQSRSASLSSRSTWLKLPIPTNDVCITTGYHYVRNSPAMVISVTLRNGVLFLRSAEDGHRTNGIGPGTYLGERPKSFITSFFTVWSHVPRPSAQ